MGNVAAPEALALRWTEVINDPTLRNLPYKLELNAWGKIEMSPASNRHGRLQALVAAELQRQMPDGIVINEASILTDIGVRVPDVVWCSPEFFRQHREVTPFPQAPEICIEIVSPSNSVAELREKTRADLAAGAREVWHISEEGGLRYYDRQGERAASAFPVTLSLPPSAE
jgi:Uma2 family endonuclease